MRDPSTPHDPGGPPPGPLPVVIGLGNRFRSDDAVGLQAIERLRRRPGLPARTETCEREPTDLLGLWEGVRLAIVVDAVRSGSPPGHVHRIVEGEHPLRPFRRAPSTHALSLPEVVELGRTLGNLPGRLVLYGVEGATFEAGERLSPKVEAALPELTARIVEELARPLGAPRALAGAGGGAHA